MLFDICQIKNGNHNSQKQKSHCCKAKQNISQLALLDFPYHFGNDSSKQQDNQNVRCSNNTHKY